MGHDRLGGADAAWLHMEEPTNPMVVDAVLELSGRLPWTRARALLARLAASTPRFRSRAVEPELHTGRVSWEPVADFALDEHIEHVQLEGGDDALRAFVGTAVSGLLDLRRPLWHVYVIDRPHAGTLLLCRVHHAVADGFALLDVLLALCDGATARVPRARTARAQPRNVVVGSARALLRVVSLRADPRTILKGPLGVEKRVAWSETLPLEDVKAVAHAAGATVNDVLVAIATGALRRYLARRGEVTSRLEVRALVPVDLRGGDAPALGNRFGLVYLGLPVGVVEGDARIAAVKARMDHLKSTPEAPVTYALLGAMGWLPRPVEDAAVSFFARKASLVLTNVPGPREPVVLAGIPVSRIVFWVPQSGRMGLGLSIFSYRGQVTVGVLADASLVPDPQVLVADLHAEYADLIGQRSPSITGGPALAAAAR